MADSIDTAEYPTTINENVVYSDNSDSDNLEQALVIAAADADARNYEEQKSFSDVKSVSNKESTDVSSELGRNIIEHTEDDNAVPAAKRLKLTDGVKEIRSRNEGYAEVVATHYNSLEEKGLDERSKSRIFYMRNFHNWIKSMLINEYLSKIKDGKKHNSAIRVMDMCCGKGGDLLKWRKGSITHLICTDIASVSLEQCESRYNDMLRRNSRERGGGNIYSVEFIVADSTKVRLREKYKDPSMKLDLVSCQFAFHYSFESLPQAEGMIRNAAECLQPGGFFIGTIPDANDLVARIKKSNSNSFGNEVYQVTFDCDKVKPPLFGAKYNFHLDGVVDCPEFLVHFATFVKLAKKYGLKLVRKEKFYEFYGRMKDEGRNLLGNMKSLETYPPYSGVTLEGAAPDDYLHATKYLEQCEGDNVRIGTLSKSEWEASSLYMTFAFEKVKNTWNSDGTPVYDI